MSTKISQDSPDREDSKLAQEALAPGRAVMDHLPSTGLLSFYDRLRERVVAYLEAKGGKVGQEASGALLLVPDTFMLLVRLSIDREVPVATRALIGGALAYFVLPAELLSELVIGPAGYLDDLVLSMLVLSHSFSRELEPLAAKHWSGSRKLHRVMHDVLQSASSLVGANVYERLRRLLAKKGIDLDPATASVKVAEPGEEAEVVY